MRRRGFLIGLGATGLGAMGLSACDTTATPYDRAKAESAFPPIGKLIGVNGLNIHATDQGAGDGPPVILIHGASGNVRDWHFGIIDKLTTGRRVIAMDRPGFGYSDRAADPDAWHPSEQAKQLRRAARRMDARKPILVGHSWGAAVALAWALDAPDEVSGVVSVSGATMAWGGLAGALSSVGVGDFAVDYYVSSLSRRADSGAIDDFLARGFSPQPVPKGYADYVGAPLALREHTLIANGDDLKNTQAALQDMASRYGELSVPLQIMHGEEDRLLKIEQHGYPLERATNRSDITPLPGVGHMAHHARPDVLLRLIEKIEAG
ncbi:MAG: alpha/beta fold hydrolase [Pikeienuella sp.]